MDKGGRSYFPCLLMLVIMLSMPLTNLSINESTDLSMDFESSTSARAQSTWSGVVELTQSYTVNVTDELIIAPCTLT